MPETALGLHPDVGASHSLSRLPGYLGTLRELHVFFVSLFLFCDFCNQICLWIYELVKIQNISELFFLSEMFLASLTGTIALKFICFL
jgi:enoyl-CoA hydratase/carnithine racemase